MSNKYKILELLKERELTVKEIAESLGFNENEARVYIHRLLEDSLVKGIGKKGRYIIYAATAKENNLENNLELIRKGFIQYNKLFEKLTKSEITKDNLRNLAKEILDFNLIKGIVEMVK